jgi:hypothetical protein
MVRYKADDYSVKLCNAIFSVIPGVEPLTHYETFGDACRRVVPTAIDAQVDKAYPLSREEDVQQAMWVLDALDGADKGIAVYTGLKSVFGSIFGSSGPAAKGFDNDPQQATDAALKGLGLCFAIAKIFPGTLQEKIAMFNRIPAGKQILAYYAVMEVAVPLTDNVLSGGGDIMQQLMDKFGKDSTSKMTTLAGAAGASEAMAVFQALSEQLNGLTKNVAQFVGPVTDKVKQYAPSALGKADKVAGAVAMAADVMPIWGLLGSHLVAEACAYRSMNGE